MNDELKPCPFCGDEPFVQTWKDESVYSHDEVGYMEISCGCGIHTDGSEDFKQVISTWNTRSNDSELSALKDENERLVNELNKANENLGFTYCAYCNQRFDIDDDAALLSDHINKCEKHPMRALEVKVSTLEKKLEEAVEALEFCAHPEGETQIGAC